MYVAFLFGQFVGIERFLSPAAALPNHVIKKAVDVVIYNVVIEMSRRLCSQVEKL